MGHSLNDSLGLDAFLLRVESGDDDFESLLDLGQRLLADQSDTADEARALLGIGICLRRLSRLPDAITSLEQARTTARPVDPVLSARAGFYLVFCLAAAGRYAEADRVAEESIPDLEPNLLPRLLVHRARSLAGQGQRADSVDMLSDAISSARQHGDVEAEAIALSNRGAVYLDMGQHVPAEIDMREALTVTGPLGSFVPAAVRHNLGLLLAQQGQLRAGLIEIDGAFDELEGIGLLGTEALIDKTEVLIEARALEQAAETADIALDTIGSEGSAGFAPRVLTHSARIAVANHAPERAAALLDQASEQSRTLGKTAGAASLARAGALLQLDRTITSVEPDDLAEPLIWEILSDRGERARRAGRRDDASTAFRLLAQAPVADRPALRTIQLFAAARLAALDGDLGSASDHLDQAYDVLDAHASALESLELRARAVEHIAPLESLATELALANSSPADLIHWTDRGRQVVLGGAAPAPSPRLLSELERLRSTIAASTGASNRTELQYQQQQIEQRIRFLSWTAERSVPGAFELRSLADLTHPGMLIYACHDDHVIGVCVGDQAEIVDLGPRQAIDRLLERLRFSATMAAREEPAPGPTQLAAIAEIARRIDAAIVAPLLPGRTPDRATIVPTGPLQAVPWRLLPSLRDLDPAVLSGRYPTKVGDTGDTRRRDRLLAITGPGLSDHTELDDLIDLYDHANALRPEQATCHAVVEAMPDADVIHIAAHGSIRSDDPLLSNLDLNDGPLTVYDIENAGTVPPTVVLACCRVGGASSSHTAAYGLATVLAARGARQIVASSVDLSDRHARIVMPELHRLLRSGLDVEEALGQLRFDDEHLQLTADSLVAIRSE